MRRAITPVIAVVLLLMMTVAAAGAAFFWMTTIQSRIQGQVGTQISTTTTQTATSLNMISTICLNNTNTSNTPEDHDYINLTIQNTGTSTIENGTIALTIIDQQNRVKSVSSMQWLGGNFDQNQIRTIEAPLVNTNNFVENNTYGVKITLPGGIEGTADCIVRKSAMN